MTIDHVKTMLAAVCSMFIDKQDELSKLDQIAGDGDHGISMARGMKAALSTLDQPYETLDALFYEFADRLVQKTGGAIGALFGTLFFEFGLASKDQTRFEAIHFINGLLHAQEVIMDIGGAKIGDKTLVDALDTTNEALNTLEGTTPFSVCLKTAETAARKGMEATKDLVAKRGRARFTKEKSKGHVDPGATSFYYLIREMNRAYHAQGGHDGE